MILLGLAARAPTKEEIREPKIVMIKKENDPARTRCSRSDVGGD